MIPKTQVRKTIEDIRITCEENAAIEFIREHLKTTEILAQLAEEATELSQAALKYRRVLEEETPTLISPSEAEDRLLEKYMDVINYIGVLYNFDQYRGRLEKQSAKIFRWAERLKAKIAQGHA